MYELLDAAGATLCDPLLIILLAVMMMPSGGSSYVFSGKTDDVGFLLLKARAAARKIPCAHRRSAQGAQAFILNGGPPISYAEFFDLPARPDNISEQIWKDMSGEKLQYRCFTRHGVQTPTDHPTAVGPAGPCASPRG